MAKMYYYNGATWVEVATVNLIQTGGSAEFYEAIFIDDSWVIGTPSAL